MTSQIEPNSGIIRASHIGNNIPDELRQKIDNSQPGAANITGANHLTITPEPKALTPSGQTVGQEVNIDAIAKHIKSTADGEINKDTIEISPDLLGNSVKTKGADPLNFETLTIRPLTIKVNDFGEANIISDATKFDSWSSIINAAVQGAKETRFFDADNADNLIEITPEDAPQSGGLRAWGGNDRILATNGNDTASGGTGEDTIVGARGIDLLRGGQGGDLIHGGEGDDIIMGDRGDDYLLGGLGDDIIRGGGGNDFLIGNAGNDILIGDAGSDFLMGGEGADQFILRGDTFTPAAAFADRILDFKPSEGDIIKIAYLKGTQGMDEIFFAAVDVNKDGITDTAILCDCGDVVGVVLSTDPTKANLGNSIFMAGPLDTTLGKIG